MKATTSVLWLAALALALEALLVWGANGPLMTPDSHEMLEMSRHLGATWGGWRPSGLPALLAVASRAGIDLRVFTALFGAARLTLIFSILLRSGWSRLGSALALILFFGPAWMMLDLSLWTEVPFFDLALVAAALFQWDSPRGRHWVWGALFFVFLGLCQVRHAGIFLLPAFAAGFAAQTGRKRLFAGATAGLLLLAGWMGINLLRSGNPLSPSRDNVQCIQGLIAFNPLPFCEWEGHESLCALDPAKSWLNRPPAEGFQDLARLQFDAGSPIVQLQARFGLEEVCAQYRLISHQAVTHAPVELASLISGRFVRLFGAWDETERGEPAPGKPPLLKMRTLNRWLGWAEKAQWINPLVLLGALIMAGLSWLRDGGLSPLLAFLLTAALGHAFGIALNNPFLALRYQAIHEAFALLALLIGIISWRSRAFRR